MSILQVFDQTSPLISGYSMRSFYITSSLQKLGVNLKVLSSPIFNYKNNQESIGNIEYYRTVINHFDLIKKFPVLKEGCIIDVLKKNIAKPRFSDLELIDAHSSVLNGLAGSAAAQKRNIPFMYEVRALWEDAAVDQGKTKEGSFRYNLTRKIETDVLRKADKVTVICEGLRNDIAKRGIDEKNIVVIPNGVDTETFVPIQKPSQEILDQYELHNVKVIGFIGTFFVFEGLDVLVRAAKKILESKKDVKFLLVGNGLDEPRIRRLVKEMGLEKEVILTGRVKHDDVNKFYSVMDFLVYPRISLRITELVTPLKPLEAMAMEKLVIASDVGGLKELVEDGQTGLLFKSGDENDLAEKCLYALTNALKMQSISKQGREYVLRERNWLTICKNYLPVFKELGVKL